MEIYKGNIISADSYDQLNVIENGYVVVENGFIGFPCGFRKTSERRGGDILPGKV